MKQTTEGSSQIFTKKKFWMVKRFLKKSCNWKDEDFPEYVEKVKQFGSGGFAKESKKESKKSNTFKLLLFYELTLVFIL